MSRTRVPYGHLLVRKRQREMVLERGVICGLRDRWQVVPKRQACRYGPRDWAKPLVRGEIEDSRHGF